MKQEVSDSVQVTQLMVRTHILFLLPPVSIFAGKCACSHTALLKWKALLEVHSVGNPPGKGTWIWEILTKETSSPTDRAQRVKSFQNHGESLHSCWAISKLTPVLASHASAHSTQACIECPPCLQAGRRYLEHPHSKNHMHNTG